MKWWVILLLAGGGGFILYLVYKSYSAQTAAAQVAANPVNAAPSSALGWLTVPGSLVSDLSSISSLFGGGTTSDPSGTADDTSDFSATADDLG
jgi:hypothetical protein